MPKFTRMMFYMDGAVHLDQPFEEVGAESALLNAVKAAQAMPSTHGPVVGVQVHQIPDEEPPLDPRLVAGYRDARQRHKEESVCPGRFHDEMVLQGLALADAVLSMVANGGVLRLDPR